MCSLSPIIENRIQYTPKVGIAEACSTGAFIKHSGTVDRKKGHKLKSRRSLGAYRLFLAVLLAVLVITLPL